MTTLSPLSVVKMMTKGAYDLQLLRMQTGLRLCANFRAKLGEAGEGEHNPPDIDDLPEEAQKMLKRLRDDYSRITDAIAAEATGKRRRSRGPASALPPRAKFKGRGLISDYAELVLVGQYIALEQQERRQFIELGHELELIPIYTEFLDGVRGIGPAMAAVIVSTLDPHKAQYVSDFWAYAGLDVASDGRGRSRRKEHLVEREYTNAAGEQATRMSITYNPWLKTKLMGVLASSFLRSNSPYRELYDSYRHRKENTPDLDWNKGHIHFASMRYMVKIFLKDLWVCWRELEGLDVGMSYAEKKLGIKHSGPPIHQRKPRAA
jgi:hypothetical protein